MFAVRGRTNRFRRIRSMANHQPLAVPEFLVISKFNDVGRGHVDDNRWKSVERGEGRNRATRERTQVVRH